MVELMYIIQFSRRYCLPLTFYCYTRPNKPHFRNVQDGGGYILSQKELSIHSLLAVPLLPLVALLRAWSIPDPIWHQILPSSLGHIIIDTLATFLSFTSSLPLFPLLFSPVFTVLLPLFTSLLPPSQASASAENETFCVKCGLNEDHFTSLVRMQTKLLWKQCSQ